MLVSNLCHFLDIDDVGVRVAESFDENRLGVGLNCVLESVFLIGVNKRCRNSRGKRESVREKVVCTAVDCL